MVDQTTIPSSHYISVHVTHHPWQPLYIRPCNRQAGVIGKTQLLDKFPVCEVWVSVCKYELHSEAAFDVFKILNINLKAAATAAAAAAATMP